MRNSWVINGNSCLYYKDGKNHRDDGENVCWIGWICRERMLWVKWGVSSGAHWIFWVCTPELYGCAPPSFWECTARTLMVQHEWVKKANWTNFVVNMNVHVITARGYLHSSYSWFDIYTSMIGNPIINFFIIKNWRIREFLFNNHGWHRWNGFIVEHKLPLIEHKFVINESLHGRLTGINVKDTSIYEDLDIN